MREILFRGKTYDGKWEQGDLRHGGYVHTDSQTYIMRSDYALHNIPVDPKTVGQYTGLTDKNGKKIFEGDIICIPFTEDTEYGEHTYYEYGTVYFDEKYLAWCVRFDDGETMFLEEYDDCATVTGNIHGNPELLGGEP